MGRPDGIKANYMDPMMQLMPHIMPKRYDAMNNAKVDIISSPIHQFIADQAAKGEEFSFNDVLLASIVRLYSQREQLNRFVVNRKIYDAYSLKIAFVIKKSLKEGGAETAVKLSFDGSETIYQVRDMINKIVKDNLTTKDVNTLDLLMNTMTTLPSFVMRVVVGLLKWLDKHGWLPKSMMDALPFHTSCFVTFLKSIKCDYIYHHIYDFGTTGIFFALGKEKQIPVVKGGTVVPEKGFTVGVTMDERFADGLYYANAVRLWNTIIARPEQLLQPGQKMFTKELVLERRKQKLIEKKEKTAQMRQQLKLNKKQLNEQKRQARRKDSL